MRHFDYKFDITKQKRERALNVLPVARIKLERALNRQDFWKRRLETLSDENLTEISL